LKTLRELLDDYIEYRKGLNYSPRSLEEYFYDCGGFLKHIEKRSQVLTASELRKSHLFSYQKSLNERKNSKGMPLNPRTLNKNLSSVRNFLNHLASKGYVLKSLPETLKPVREPSFLPIGALKHAEIRRVLRKINISTPEGYRDRTLLEILYSSGIRASELSGLNVESVDLENSTMTVFGKGSKERIVPIGKTALRFLETYMKAIRPFLLKDGEKKALFLNNSGTRLMRYTLGLIVNKYYGEAKLDVKVTPHTFRRSCTTELIRSEANLYHVKELLGHESLSTVKHYAKLTITDLKRTHARCHPREKDKS
jgi:integrase/recombinase XerD